MDSIINLFDHTHPHEHAIDQAREKLIKQIKKFTTGRAETKKISVLYVDDEIHNLQGFKANYRKIFNVFLAVTTMEAERIIETEKIDVVICDQKMPNLDGIQLLCKIKQKNPTIARILVTAYKTMEVAMSAVNEAKVFSILEKPFNFNKLELTIKEAYQA